MPLPKPEETEVENIHTATLACISGLEACLSIKPLMKEGWAENRLADINLWASRVGALARPKASLDRRLEFQPKARLVLSNLLLTLEKFIEVCRIHAINDDSTEIVQPRDEGTPTARMEMPLVVDSESTSSAESWFMKLGRDNGIVSDSSSDSYAEDQTAYSDHETKLKRSMDDVVDLIDQLIMLGFAIRKSGTAARLQKADKTFNPNQNTHLRTYLESMVLRNTDSRRQDSTFSKGLSSEDRMHQADAIREMTGQQNHLIIANLRRRHRFNYARRHHLDLGQQIAKPMITKSVLSTSGPRQSQSRMTRNQLGQGLDESTMTPIALAIPASSPEVPEARGTSETTASAVEGSILKFTTPSEPATSVMSMSIRNLEYPSPPPISKLMRGFKCPCCYQTLPEMFHESSRWRKHLTEDLCPYTCPFSDCEKAEVLYISRTAWCDHVLESHGRGEYWECQPCSGAEHKNIFPTAEDLAQHNHSKHGILISKDEIADLQAFCRNIEPPNISHCPLCLWPEGEEVIPDAMTNLEHIGSCIHEFSLNALPWATSLSHLGATSVTLSSPNVEEWLTGTVETKSNIEKIRDIDATAVRPLPRQPPSPIQDPVHITGEYFAEISKDSSQAERGSRIPSDISISGGSDEVTTSNANPTTPKSHPPRPSDRRAFKIAIICALTLEADAIEALFDHHWEDSDGPPFDKEPDDPNAYSTGMIDRFNVVLAYMPGMGKVNASTVAANCGKSFPSIKLALVVGICGVAPFSPTQEEIILGDVIISNGVIQYDFGRQLPDRLIRKGTLLDVPDRPNLEIRGLLAKLHGLRHRRQLNAEIDSFLEVLRRDPELHAEYPGSSEDKLFEATYRHAGDQSSCEQARCEGELVQRNRLSATDAPPKPVVHFGLIASGDKVMKSGEDRDRIASMEGVIAFDMEGASVCDSFPCIIIKGACDYADSHKSKVWHRYAAATAAACAKAFLSYWFPSFTPGLWDEASDGQTAISLRTQYTTAAKSRNHYLPFSRNKGFTGRQEIITELQTLLFSDQNGQRVALVGLGGVGKTQIALELAHLVRKDDQADRNYSVIWMPASSMATFEQSCTRIIREFGIEWVNEEDPKEIFKRFLSSEKARKWFLIVDNSDDIETIYGTAEAPGGIDQFIPDCDHGYILYTTRSREIAISVAQRNVITVSEMDGQDAKALLMGSMIDENQLKHTVLIDKLLHKLAYLPLAITQASAYMNFNVISIKEYLSLLQGTDKDVVELLSRGFRDSTHYDSSQSAVATTWIVSFKQIRALHEDAATLLSATAYLEPKAIPRALLPPLGSEQKMARAIGTLCGYSFLSKREDGETFDMHSLVHLAIQRWNKEEGLEAETRQMAFAHLAGVFPSDDWEDRELWRQYMPHALRLLNNTDGANAGDRCRLGYKVGGCLITDGQTTQAVHTLESVVEVQRATLAENDRHRLAGEHRLASAYLINGQTKQAIELLEHVVTIQAHTLTENDPDRLALQHELALAYHSDGQITQVIELLEHVVEMRVKVLTEDHPDRLASEHSLGIAYQENGQIKEAIKLLEHVVAVKAGVLSEDHPDRQQSVKSLQHCYDRLEGVSVSGESDGCETIDGM